MGSETCPGRTEVDLGAVTVEARCLMRRGHEGECAADSTRVLLRWPAPEPEPEEVGDGSAG